MERDEFPEWTLGEERKRMRSEFGHTGTCCDELNDLYCPVDTGHVSTERTSLTEGLISTASNDQEGNLAVTEGEFQTNQQELIMLISYVF